MAYTRAKMPTPPTYYVPAVAFAADENGDIWMRASTTRTVTPDRHHKFAVHAHPLREGVVLVGDLPEVTYSPRALPTSGTDTWLTVWLES